jgi:hypothetical protein
MQPCVMRASIPWVAPLSAMHMRLQAGALVDSDLDEEDENAAKIRETVALARGQLCAAVC